MSHDSTVGCPECGQFTKHHTYCTQPYAAEAEGMYARVSDVAEPDFGSDHHEIYAEAPDGSRIIMRPTADSDGPDEELPNWYLYREVQDNEFDIDTVPAAEAAQRFREELDKVGQAIEAADHAMGVCMPEYCHVHKEQAQ